MLEIVEGHFDKKKKKHHENGRDVTRKKIR